MYILYVHVVGPTGGVLMKGVSSLPVVHEAGVHCLTWSTQLYTIPSRKSAHGRCTLHWAQAGGWADIRVTSAAF